MLIAVALAWVKGGHPERRGAVILLTVFGLSLIVHPWRLWNVHLGDAALDGAITLIFGWMAVTGNRWWPLAMTAVMALTLLIHFAAFAAPSMSHSADISARIGLGILTALALLAGVGERWLAGEPAVSSGARWRRSKAT
ncbi:MAG: hypothetical protein H2038_02665 [Brevundimonas sp.]|uniref:hypothetical protein n=1 Tax=Brevundimonas sp. TaxID=1871086 RepID=UPI0017CA8C41|nr:hypothetical protein [Brevundimonas sp.]MBA4803537.1 hypothetical protein [Brevundimonas sp.]